MFHDLDATLKQVLHDQAAPALLSGAEVSFLTPDKNLPPTISGATVNLFLYEVRENRELRDPTPILEKVGDSFVRRTPPLRVDCTYIVTTWSAGTGEVRVAEEHQLLALALLWLGRFPAIPAGFLQGGLADQLYPPPTMVAQFDPNKNAGEFWNALAIPPRPAFYLTVTIALDLDLAAAGPLVTTRSTTVNGETWVQIGGQVLTPRLTLARAQATLANAANDQATVTPAPEAANFRPGDIVFLQQDGVSERATVAAINGATLVFAANLAHAYNGGVIRIADLMAGQRTMRPVGPMLFKPGAMVKIAQGQGVTEKSEVQVVQAADPVTGAVTLAQGLTKSYPMGAADGPVTVGGQGIAGALLDILDAGLRTTSDADGRYTFPRVPGGAHRIQVAAVGYQVLEQSLEVPGLPGDYVLTLQPL